MIECSGKVEGVEDALLDEPGVGHPRQDGHDVR
jgi:hypothetical protein